MRGGLPALLRSRGLLPFYLRRLHMRRFRLWLAYTLLPSGYTAVDQSAAVWYPTIWGSTVTDNYNGARYVRLTEK